jgi:N-acetyl-anhydromuramyl-L-alanine amidase AmpD
MTGYANATWIPSPFFTSGRNGYTPKWLILHGTAGGSSAQNIAAWFQNPQAQVSAHYIVGQDGAVVQSVDESNWAWANGALSAGHDNWWSDSVNPNWITISIEHVKPSTSNSDTLTAAQQSASFKLIKDICTRWNIPMQAANASGGITGHYSIDPVNRSDCPGPYPWTQLWAYLNGTSTPSQGGTTMSIPNGWSDNGTILKAPNCPYEITQGFRSYILSHTWDSANIPVGSAQGLNPLELSNTSLGSGTRQLFRWSALEWTSKAGVFEGWIGQELATTVALLNRTQNDLKALQISWNDVVAKKNELISTNRTLTLQLSQAQQPSGDVTQLQQQIEVLKQQNATQAAQVQAYYNKLTQIGVSATQIVTLANTK